MEVDIDLTFSTYMRRILFLLFKLFQTLVIFNYNYITTKIVKILSFNQSFVKSHF